MYLSIIFDRQEWKETSLDMIQALKVVILKHPTSFCNWCLSVQLHTNGMKEIVVTGQEILKELAQMLKKYVPNKILQSTTSQVENYPLLAAKLVDRVSWFYLCDNYSCLSPKSSIDDFLSGL